MVGVGWRDDYLRQQQAFSPRRLAQAGTNRANLGETGGRKGVGDWQKHDPPVPPLPISILMRKAHPQTVSLVLLDYLPETGVLTIIFSRNGFVANLIYCLATGRQGCRKYQPYEERHNQFFRR
jgi:hypothetical protein